MYCEQCYPTVKLTHRPKSFLYIFYGLECVGNSFAYVAHFVILRDVRIRTQWTAVASMRATNLATHLQWWAKLLRLLTVNSLSYFVRIKY